jgi:hypothetical protein
MMEALSSSEPRFSQEPHGVTTQKEPFFMKNIKFDNLAVQH